MPTDVNGRVKISSMKADVSSTLFGGILVCLVVVIQQKKKMSTKPYNKDFQDYEA